MATSKQQVEAINLAIKSLDNAIKNPKVGRNAAVRQEECARSAIASIRLLQKSTKLSLHDLRLEEGISALIGKCITLGLDDLAFKELRLLKRSLQLIIQRSRKTSNKVSTDSNIDSGAPNGSALSLTDLLVYPNVTTDCHVFELVRKSQVHALRLLSTCKKPKVLRDALPLLQPDRDGSPIDLLQRMASRDDDTSQRIVKHMEHLSCLVMALTPSISASEDATIHDSTTNVTPITAFKLQTLSYEIKFNSWKRSTHEPDYTKEFLVPYTRCISTLIRRHDNPLETYTTVSASLAHFLNLLKNSAMDHELAMTRLYMLLSSLAEEAGIIQDAIKWMSYLQQDSSTDGSLTVQTCLVAARQLSLQLQSKPDHPQNEDLVNVVLQGTRGTLMGMKRGELEQLIISIAAVRRTAIQLVSKNRSKTTLVGGQMTTSLRKSLEDFMLSFPKFYLRLIGPAPTNDAHDNTRHEYLQRHNLVAQYIDPTLDSILYLLKVYRDEGHLTWAMLDTMLSDCLELLRTTREFCPTSMISKEKTPSYLAKVSQLYYIFYRTMDQSTPEEIALGVKSLQRSVDSVYTGTRQDKLDSSADAKIEKLATIYISQNRYVDAVTYASRLLHDLVQRGALTTIAQVADSRPLSEGSSSNTDTTLLVRMLSTLMTALSPFPVSLMMETLAKISSDVAAEDAVLFELILQLQTTGDTERLRAIANELLTRYEVKQFPLRRLRVLCQLSLLEMPNLEAAVREVISVASKSAQVQRSCDTQLQNYAADLTTLISTITELRQIHPRLDIIRQHLAVWAGLIDECKVRSALANRINDVDTLVLHLTSISDYLALHDSGPTRVAVLKLIATIHELNQVAAAPDDLWMSYTRMGSEYLQLGYSGKAETVLGRVTAQSIGQKASPFAMARYNLAIAAHQLVVGDSEKCAAALNRAQGFSKQWASDKDVRTTRGKAAQAQCHAEASMICSRLSLQQGNPAHALRLARQTLRLTYRAWDFVDKELKSNSGSSHPLSEPRNSKSNTETNTSTTRTVSPEERSSGSPFWHLVPILFQSLTWLSHLYVYYGMYQEAIYYSQQADRVVSKSGIGALSASALTNSASIWLKAGLKEKASLALSEAERLATSGSVSTINATIQLRNAHVQVLSGHEQGGLQECETASATMDRLMDVKYIQGLDQIVDEASTLVTEVAKLSLDRKKPISKRSTKTTSVVKKPPVRLRAKAKPVAQSSVSLQDECLGLSTIKGEIFHIRAQALLLIKRLDDATTSMTTAGELLAGRHHIEQHILMARLSLAKGLEQLSTDPVYSVLQDSTISYPQVVCPPPTVNTAKSTTLTSNKNVTPPKATIQRGKTTQTITFVDHLQVAQEHLIEAYHGASQTASSHVVHNICSLLNITGMFLSIAGIQKGGAGRDSYHVSFPPELARNMAYTREIVVSADHNASKQEDLDWPQVKPSDSNKPCTGIQFLSQGVIEYQKDYINLLPDAWNLLTISLSETQQELCITKLQCGQTPFVLRIPLGRENTSRDIDDDVFDFEQGRRDLNDIVAAANDSAHSARGLTTKASKADWWTNRDVLNFRMQELLENIEKVWIGGFRGIFSSNPRNTALLARFQTSFTNILDKHLPSRQRTGRKKAVSKVNLDPRILELFVELGTPSDPGSDFSEILTDLLYFVVDILQFHGERNAYDEIDWDRIVVDTMGALEHYHEALSNNSSSSPLASRHTILIIDKALHEFPWESIPCLANQPVSRMPSLGALRDRIINMSTTHDQTRPGHYIDRSKGSYILNPSNDLINTAETFAPLLESLSLPPSKTFISRAPTEPEFSTLLTTSDYLLYFGHGSGTQYIRPKTIRKIRSPNVAVSFLMGCSSGAMTQAGEFEAYGTPINYLLAGAPAIVANLWDVTDRDCDRFAVGCLEAWGLFERERRGGSERSLVEAVGVGREKCQFRYLTAAAVVIYGVPVYLK